MPLANDPWARAIYARDHMAFTRLVFADMKARRGEGVRAGQYANNETRTVNAHVAAYNDGKLRYSARSTYYAFDDVGAMQRHIAFAVSFVPTFGSGRTAAERRAFFRDRTDVGLLRGNVTDLVLDRAEQFVQLRADELAQRITPSERRERERALLDAW